MQNNWNDTIIIHRFHCDP